MNQVHWELMQCDLKKKTKNKNIFLYLGLYVTSVWFPDIGVSDRGFITVEYKAHHFTDLSTEDFSAWNLILNVKQNFMQWNAVNVRKGQKKGESRVAVQKKSDIWYVI